MKIFKDKRIKVLLILALICGGLWGLKLLAGPAAPQIIKTVPADNQTEVAVKEKIVLSFGQKVKSEEWQIVPFPAFKFDLKASENNLEIQPTEGLKTDTQYRLEVKSPRWSDFYFTFSFTTIPIPLPIQIPQGKGDPDFYEKIESDLQKNYPLIKKTPHITANWAVYYKGPLELLVKLKKDTPAIRNEVLDWIRTNGVDPASHKITWRLES